MKSFWQRPPKKRKKKQKQKPTPQKSNALQPLLNSKPTPWVPPHPVIPRAPSIEDISKLPVTYQIPSVPEKEEKTPIQTSPEQKMFRQKDEHIRKEFLKTFRSLTNRWRSWDIWTDFVTMTACAISNSVDKLHFDKREKTYLRIINKNLYSQEDKTVVK